MGYIIIGIIIWAVIAWIVESIKKYIARKRYNEALDKVLPLINMIDFKKIDDLNLKCTTRSCRVNNSKDNLFSFVKDLTKRNDKRTLPY